MPLRRANTMRAICAAYRNVALEHERAFERGDVRAIEETFSRMQEIARAFLQGAEWARNNGPARHRSPGRDP